MTSSAGQQTLLTSVSLPLGSLIDGRPSDQDSNWWPYVHWASVLTTSPRPDPYCEILVSFRGTEASGDDLLKVHSSPAGGAALYLCFWEASERFWVLDFAAVEVCWIFCLSKWLCKRSQFPRWAGQTLCRISAEGGGYRPSLTSEAPEKLDALACRGDFFFQVRL